MSGKDARRGFRFQDACILIQLLRAAVEGQRRELLGLTPLAPFRVLVEASVERPSDGDDTSSWDSVAIENDEIVVDETKLGKVTRPDRFTMYRRIRATAERHGAVDTLAIRLTCARGKQPNPEKWIGLAAAASVATPPDAAPSEANDAHELAAEALHALTTLPMVDRRGKPLPPLSLVDARAILSRFRYDETYDPSSAAEEIERLLGKLGVDVAVELAVRELNGWIAEHAAAGGPPAELSSESILRELHLVARHAAIAPEAGRLWRSLRSGGPQIAHGAVREHLRRWRAHGFEAGWMMAGGSDAITVGA